MKLLQRSKKLVLYSTSLTVITIGTILGCAGGWEPEDLLYTFFAPEVSGSSLRPFFRSYHIFYDNEYEYGSNVDLFKNINVVEWKRHFNDRVDSADIAYVLYEASIPAIDSMIFSIKDPKYKLLPPLSANSLLKYDERIKAKDFLFYVGFAKRCEKVAAVDNMWYWDEEERSKHKMPSDELNALITNGRKAWERQKEPFIKDRYLFQLARLLYFAENYQEAISLADANPARSSAIIESRIEGYKAASLYKQKKYAEANLIYARMFQMDPPFQAIGYLSFHPQNEDDWNRSLNLASTVKEKTSLWCLLGIYHDPVRAMKEIHALDPTSEYMDLLLVRTVRLMEEQFNGERETGYDSEREKLQNTDLKAVKDFVRNIRDAKRITDPFLWELSYGYLSLMDNDRMQMEASFRNAQTLAGKDKMLFSQIRLFRLLADVADFDPSDKKKEDKLAIELTWVKSGADGFFETQRINTFEYSLKEISRKYAAAGNEILAECFYPQPGKYYSTSERAENMMAFLNKKEKSAIEKFAAEVYRYKPYHIADLEAVKATYAGNIEKAIQLLEKYPAEDEAILPGDPFLIHINDCHDCDHQRPQDVRYTKLSFLKKVKQLKEDVMSAKRVADNAFLLGNAYYNITYYGNARRFYENEITYGYFVDYEYVMPDVKDPVYDCSEAEKYYVLAMNASKDPEFRAKSCFMAAKCEQNAFFTNTPQDYSGDFKAGTYFNKLKKEFSSTGYYKEIIKECGYFRTYVNR